MVSLKETPTAAYCGSSEPSAQTVSDLAKLLSYFNAP